MSAISTNLSVQRLDTPNIQNAETTDETAKKTMAIATKNFAAMAAITHTITMAAVVASVCTTIVNPTALIIGGIALAILLIAITDPESCKEAADTSVNEADGEGANDEISEDVKVEKNKDIAKELLCPGEIHAVVGTR